MLVTPLRSLLLASVLLCVAVGPAPAAEPVAKTSAAPAKRPKVCLVLSGGGARGVAHIGVLKVLEELRVPVDCIVGTSMGSLVGGGFAYGKSPAEMERLVREANWDDVLLDQPPRPNRSVRAKALDRQSVGGVEFGIRGAQIQLPTGAIIGQQLEFFLQGLAGPNQHGELRQPADSISRHCDRHRGRISGRARSRQPAAVPARQHVGTRCLLACRG